MIISLDNLRGQCNHDHTHFNLPKSELTDESRNSSSNKNDTWFTDVSQEAGINYIGVSYSSSWGDINGDGYLDIFAGNHGTPICYYNNGGSFFSETYIPYYADTLLYFQGDVISRADALLVDPDFVDTALVKHDIHATSFIDIDNDGDQDFFSSIGAQNGSGIKSNTLFLNDGNDLIIENEAVEIGLLDEFGRGRGQLWLDQDNDGSIDLFQCNIERDDDLGPTTFLEQSNGFFTDFGGQIGLVETNLRFAQLNTIGNGSELSLLGMSNNTIYNYSLGAIPFEYNDEYISASLTDVAIGDFNGDLIPDIYTTSGGEATEAKIINDTVLAFMSKTNFGAESLAEVRFKSEGELSFIVGYTPSPAIGITSKIFIGSGRNNPSSESFTLDPNDPKNQGYAGSSLLEGIYIGYLVNSDKWVIRVLDYGISNIPVVVTSNNPITDLQYLYFGKNDNLKDEFIFFQNGDGSYTKEPRVVANSRFSTSSSSVTAADFDNDMDLDIYLSNTMTTGNEENTLLINDGSGNFNVISGHGAEGTLEGRGGTVISGDYDNNGTIDLFVENGHGLYFNNGPLQLFRNNFTLNNWIQIDLQGTISNKDGIGALVYCYAGGKGQVRLNQNGIHKYGQDQQRIHFGLAQNVLIDSIVVQWPSGAVNTFKSLAVNQIITLVENPTISSVLNNLNESLQIYSSLDDRFIHVNPVNAFRDENVQINLYELSGKLLLSRYIGQFSESVSLNNSLLADGIYIVEYKGDKGYLSKKLVKF